MSRISKAFENGKAFITFITCGDPDLETTKRVVLSAIDNGADMVELGIPFSDPTAEGPVIQAANARALAGGVTTDKIFDMVRELRKETAKYDLSEAQRAAALDEKYGTPRVGDGGNP